MILKKEMPQTPPFKIFYLCALETRGKVNLN